MTNKSARARKEVHVLMGESRHGKPSSFDPIIETDAHEGSPDARSPFLQRPNFLMSFSRRRRERGSIVFVCRVRCCSVCLEFQTSTAPPPRQRPPHSLLPSTSLFSAAAFTIASVEGGERKGGLEADCFSRNRFSADVGTGTRHVASHP